MDPLTIIASTIAVTQAISSTYKAIKHIKGLPKAFNEVNQNLPLVQDTLEAAHRQLQGTPINDASAKAIEPVLNRCKKKATSLLEIFQKIDDGKKKNGESMAVFEFYRTIVVPMGKAHRVEALMQDIVKNLKSLAMNQLFKTATQSQMPRLENAIQELSRVQPSVPDSDFEETPGTNATQNIAKGGKGNQAVNSGQGSQKIIFGDKFSSGGGSQRFGMDYIRKRK